MWPLKTNGTTRKQRKLVKEAAREYHEALRATIVVVSYEMSVNSRDGEVVVSESWHDEHDQDGAKLQAAAAYFSYVGKIAWNIEPEGDEFLDRLAAGDLQSSLTNVDSVLEETSNFKAELHLNLETDAMYPQTPAYGDDEVAGQIAQQLAVNLRDHLVDRGTLVPAAFDAGMDALLSAREAGRYVVGELETLWPESVNEVLERLVDMGFLSEPARNEP